MNENSIELAPQNNYLAQLNNYENGLLTAIHNLGLPTDNIFVDLSERSAVFNNLGPVLSRIQKEQLSSSKYLSKFLAASMSGLFDAALNYLWDETINEIRKRVTQYDVSYFYDNAVGEEKRKKLSGAEDISKLDDAELIFGARSIGLISELGYKHLDYIRYMRNWASAAHPNQNQLTGLQLISWLETCVKEVISLPLSSIVVEIKKLLSNIKQNVITADEAKQIANFFMELTPQQVSTLAHGFAGIYTDDNTIPQARQNIHHLLPYLWGYIDEETKFSFGIKYGKFVANNEQGKAVLSRQFLEIVQGVAYIPDGLKAAEIDIAIQNLLNAHRALGNVYSEPGFARQLASLVGQTGIVPHQVRMAYVHCVVDVFLTNGHAEAWHADPIYLEMIGKFSQDESIIAMLSFSTERINSKLQFNRCQSKYVQLLTIIRQKLSASSAIEVCEHLTSFTGPLDKLGLDSKISQKIQIMRTTLSQ